MTTRHIPPPILYHGTGAMFDAFAPNDRGIFFAESYEAAASYQRIRKTDTPRVLAASVYIANPWVQIRYGLDVPYSQQLDQSAAALAARGYDGIYMPEERVWVAFRPEQIEVLLHDFPAADFVPHLHAAVEHPARLGFSFKEGSSWAMALALRTALGHGSEIVLCDDSARAYVRAGGKTYDWHGESTFAGGRVVTRDELLKAAIAHGCTEAQLDADCERAGQIIDMARFLSLLSGEWHEPDSSEHQQCAPRG